jgi:hypothetical protein
MPTYYETGPDGLISLTSRYDFRDPRQRDPYAKPVLKQVHGAWAPVSVPVIGSNPSISLLGGVWTGYGGFRGRL